MKKNTKLIIILVIVVGSLIFLAGIVFIGFMLFNWLSNDDYNYIISNEQVEQYAEFAEIRAHFADGYIGGIPMEEVEYIPVPNEDYSPEAVKRELEKIYEMADQIAVPDGVAERPGVINGDTAVYDGKEDAPAVEKREEPKKPDTPKPAGYYKGDGKAGTVPSVQTHTHAKQDDPEPVYIIVDGNYVSVTPNQIQAQKKPKNPEPVYVKADGEYVSWWGSYLNETETASLVITNFNGKSFRFSFAVMSGLAFNGVAVVDGNIAYYSDMVFTVDSDGDIFVWVDGLFDDSSKREPFEGYYYRNYNDSNDFSDYYIDYERSDPGDTLRIPWPSPPPDWSKYNDWDDFIKDYLKWYYGVWLETQASDDGSYPAPPNLMLYGSSDDFIYDYQKWYELFGDPVTADLNASLGDRPPAVIPAKPDIGDIALAVNWNINYYSPSRQFYREILSKKQQLAYDILMTELQLGNLKVDCNFGINVDEADQVLYAVKADHPEFFYIFGYAYWADDTVTVMQFLPDADIMKIGIDNVLSAIRANTATVIQKASGLKNPADKAQYIAEYLCDEISYSSFPETCMYSQSIYSGLVMKEAVCTGYAKSFQYLANLFGIEATILNSSFHQWNLMKLDGDYYYTDIAWMDYPSSRRDAAGNEIKEKYTYNWFVFDENIINELGQKQSVLAHRRDYMSNRLPGAFGGKHMHIWMNDPGHNVSYEDEKETEEEITTAITMTEPKTEPQPKTEPETKPATESEYEFPTYPEYDPDEANGSDYEIIIDWDDDEDWDDWDIDDWKAWFKAMGGEDEIEDWDDDDWQDWLDSVNPYNDEADEDEEDEYTVILNGIDVSDMLDIVEINGVLYAEGKSFIESFSSSDAYEGTRYYNYYYGPDAEFFGSNLDLEKGEILIMSWATDSPVYSLYVDSKSARLYTYDYIMNEYDIITISQPPKIVGGEVYIPMEAFAKMTEQNISIY